MEKLDLIIDALQRVELLFEAHGQYPHTLREVKEALAAANELRGLQPVVFCALTPNGMMGYFDGKPMIMVGKIGNDCHTTPLYAL